MYSETNQFSQQWMPGSWDDSHYLPEGADSFEPTQQHRRERFEHLYAQSQHSYRWFQWLQREADSLFRQVAFLSPTDINADPWKAQVRVLLQQVRELLHSKICSHMHQEKNIWYFRLQDEKESLRLRVRELTTCVERCKETIGSYKSKLSCINWEHMVTSLMYRHVSRVFRRLRRFRSFP